MSLKGARSLLRAPENPSALVPNAVLRLTARHVLAALGVLPPVLAGLVAVSLQLTTVLFGHSILLLGVIVLLELSATVQVIPNLACCAERLTAGLAFLVSGFCLLTPTQKSHFLCLLFQFLFCIAYSFASGSIDCTVTSARVCLSVSLPGVFTDLALLPPRQFGLLDFDLFSFGSFGSNRCLA